MVRHAHEIWLGQIKDPRLRYQTEQLTGHKEAVTIA